MAVLSTFGIDILLSLPQVTVFLLYAIGIVVIYRASRVLNLAHGVMAMIPAYVYYSLATHGVPPVLAAAGGIAFGAGLGIGTERLIVRRLRPQGPTAQTIAKLYGTAPLVTPHLFPSGTVAIGYTGLSYGQLMLFGIGLVLAGAMFAFFRFTDIGLAMQGAADNRRGAQLMGINVERTTMLAWALGGGLAGAAGVFVGAITNIHPYTLSLQVLPAFVAVLIGGLESLPGALLGAAVVGLIQGEVPTLRLIPLTRDFASSIGFSDLVLMVITFVVLGVRGKRLVGSRVRDEALATAQEAPASRQKPGRPRRSLFALAAVAVAAFPFLPFVPFSFLGDATLAAFYLLAALSVVLLTGWVGQISLAQAEFVGVGAFFTAILANKLGIQFPISFFLAAALGGLIAAALGIVALRVRGLYLAVATLVFAGMADNFLFNAEWFGGNGGVADILPSAIGNRGGLPYFDLTEIRLVYLLMVAIAAGCVYALANLREGKSGRAFFAIRGSEVAAASLGIDVARYKLFAFLIAGALAGAAGNLYMINLRSVDSSSFSILISLFFLSIAVVGGLLSLGGAVVAAMVFAALQEVFFRVPQLAGLLNVVSSGLLLAVLLAYPGGLAALPQRLLALAAPLRLRRRTSPASGEESEALELNTEPWRAFERGRRPGVGDARPEEVLCRADGVTVRFGGLTAVNGVNLEVHRGEIVGLIGANGAGKTTCFNAISGLVTPAAGKVDLYGRSVARLDVHQRAALGVARTFQDIQLFPQLTVFENLLVATHLQNRSTVVEQVLVAGRALPAERAARQRVHRIIGFLGLRHLASRPIRDLTFGQLRLVEVARALVTGAELVLLDEPASGLDDHESEMLVQLLLYVRAEFGLTMLVVEHDVRAVLSLCDYIYVLDQGKLISEGRPQQVQADPVVVEAYLGQAAGVA
jgi:ABC-type branched-subunit amino acid transport system ATPase component/branched-subunit amino acid ABC-type transport system permease component